MRGKSSARAVLSRQAASLLKGHEIEPVEVVMERFVAEYYRSRRQLINQAMEEQMSRRTY